jgi:glycosyltransferase involved in cell wall biosynthesis/GT2 family glycosyltransferase
MSVPQKIIFFSDAIFLGGAEECLKILVTQIDRGKYSPRVALPNRPATQPLADFFQARGIPVDFVESHDKAAIPNFMGPWRYFRRQKPDFIHFNLNNSFGCFFPVLAAASCRVPFRIATEHLTFGLASGRRAGILTKELVKKILTFYLDSTITVSQANKELLMRDYRIDSHRIKLVRNGINLQKFRFSATGRERIRQEFGIQEDHLLVGTVARFSFQKGHEFTVNAIPAILQAHPEARFLFVGDGPEREKISQNIREAGLSRQVIITGERQDIPDLLSAMDLFLLTSIFEGLPLSVLEAMAVGLPVVATRVNGTPEAVAENDTGLLIPPADPEAVVGSVNRLLGNPTERKRMGALGRKRVEKHFDESYMVRQVTDIYDNMLALSRPPRIPKGVPFQSPRRASIIVLSWNHKELLQECLDAIKKAVIFEGGDHEIIVVDNGSTDGTADYVRLQYPEVRLVDLKKNYRFSMGNNYGVQCAKNDVVILLNNDVIVEEDFLRPLLEGFQASNIFAVTSQIFNYYQSKVREETGKTFGAIVFGSVLVGHMAPSPFDSERKLVPVFYAGGGSTAYWRDKYLELRGFSELYNPAYVEDADISYRAWKSGYRVLFCPSSRVVHKHRSTTVLELGSKGIDYYISRNLFIFFWKNITSLGLFARHLGQFPIRILVDMSRGNFAILVAFVAALLKIPRILLERIRFGNPTSLSDREVFEATGSWFFYKHRYLAPSSANPGRLKILVVSKRLPRRGMDGSWILVNLLEGLSRHHDITLISFVETPPDQVHAEPLKKFCQEVRTITLYPYHDELKSAYLFSKFLALFHAFLLMRKEVRKELQNGDYDLVQCEYLHTLNFVPDLSHVPSLLSHHEVLTLAYERSFRQAQGWIKKTGLFWKWRLTRAYEKRILRKVSQVVLLSEKDQDYLTRKMKIFHSTVIRSGVTLDQLIPTGRVEEDPHSLIFVGYFKHPPNVEAMLYLFRDLWPSLVRAVPDLKITVIGRYAPPEIMAYSRTDRVTFVDYVPDLRTALEQHAVFVAPIISGAGLRGKILEAMAMGKAIVATRRCMDGYPFCHNRELMVADNSEEFIRYTVELLQDGEKRRSLGRNARACVEAQFSSDRFVADYERLCTQLTESAVAKPGL